MKTATIHRSHIYGTPRHELTALYRGRGVSYWQSGHVVSLRAPHWFGVDHEALMAEWARRLLALGFTHWRFEGEWGKNPPRGGRIPAPASPEPLRPTVAWTGGSKPRAWGELSAAERAMVRQLMREQCRTYADAWGNLLPPTRTCPVSGKPVSSLCMARQFWKHARYDAHATYRE